MKCEEYCKHFEVNSIGGTGQGKVITGGMCRKYNIQTSTEKTCLDTLPYHEK